jgi:hypothetical protein
VIVVSGVRSPYPNYGIWASGTTYRIFDQHTTLEHPVQRKLAAILAADVVGYSHLMEADEAGTLSRLKTTREQVIGPKIATFGGRMVKLMGDGMLVEFPSVVDAVTSAVEIQRAMNQHNAELPPSKRFQLRIGVNLRAAVAARSRGLEPPRCYPPAPQSNLARLRIPPRPLYLGMPCRDEIATELFQRREAPPAPPLPQGPIEE